jgi:hypothetical protein
MAPVKGVCIIDLEAGEGRIKHSPARHDDHVQARHDLMTPEDLPREAFGAIPLDSGTEFPAGRYAEPRDCSAVGDDEQRHEASWYANA